MPPTSLIDGHDIRPCNECHEHKKTHFSELIKTHSLRHGPVEKNISSTINQERFNKNNHSNESLHRIQGADSSTNHEETIVIKSSLKPSHSFLHEEFSRIRALRNAQKNLISQAEEPAAFTVSINEHHMGDSLIENDDATYEVLSPIKNIVAEPLPFVHIAATTQTSEKNTSGKNTLPRTIYQKIQSNKDNMARLIIRASGIEKKVKPKTRLCSKSSCILICAYLLMIIIGIVVSVVVTQREQQDRPRPSTGFSGAQLSFQESVSDSRRRSNPKLVPATSGRIFDYYDDINAADTGAAPSRAFPPFKAISRQQAAISSQPAPRPIRVIPKQKAEKPRDIIRSSQSTSNSRGSIDSRKRQGPSDNFNHQFGIADQVEEESPVGRKEPAVKIIKSWANTHPDGSYTWGYINTDGSFKNETRGADCVVRGIYGYADPITGETMSFPYISGNPCDPNEPDYYYDYDAGTINSGGVVVQSRKQDRDSKRRVQK